MNSSHLIRFLFYFSNQTITFVLLIMNVCKLSKLLGATATASIGSCSLLIFPMYFFLLWFHICLPLFCNMWNLEINISIYLSISGITEMGLDRQEGSLRQMFLFPEVNCTQNSEYFLICYGLVCSDNSFKDLV